MVLLHQAEADIRLEVVTGVRTCLLPMCEPIELVPRGVTTVTSTVPLAGVGGVAKITVSLCTVKLGEAVAPKSTAVAPVKPQPQSVIGSFVKFWLGPVGAPIVGPWLGFIPVERRTVGSVVPENGPMNGHAEFRLALI